VRGRPITVLNLEHGNLLRPTSSGLAMREMITDRKTISIMKACELVGVSRRTIYNWIASGQVEYVRTAGGSVRIFVDTLWREPGRAGELTSKEAS
jgi:excisionase family DNA binding protein